MEKYIPKSGDTIVNGRRMLVIGSTHEGMCYVVAYTRSYFTGLWYRGVSWSTPRDPISAHEVSALVNHMGWKLL